MSDRYAHLVERLQDVAEELADLAIEELKTAVRTGSGRPPVEKQLTQARRAIEKAVHLLQTADRADGADDD